MKKAATLVDKALEVARQVKRVPQKPVKTKGKKTVPAVLDWGPGIPLDKLAYLNDEEMALIQAKRMFKGKRDYKGIPAFPDPGDTAAGDTGQGTSSSSGLGGNTGGTSTYGGGGGSDSGAGGAGGMGNYGGSTGGGSDSGNLGGGTSAAGGAGSTTGGGSDSGSPDSGATSSASSSTSSTGASDQTKSSGPSGGPTGQPARTETSYSGTTTSPAASSSFNSFSSPGSYNPVTSAPSSMAAESALDRIASGSSVIGNTAPGGYPTPKMEDRVPQTVSYTPATSTPASQTIGGDIYAGANSPFADPNVSQYNADNPSLAGAVNQYSQYRSPPSPTTSAYTNTQNQMYAAQDAANFGEDGVLPRGTGYSGVMDPTPTSYSPTPSQYTPSDMAGTTRAYGALSGPNVGLGYNPTTPGTYVSGATSPTQVASLSSANQTVVNPAETVVGQTDTSPYTTLGPNQGLGYNPAAPGLAAASTYASAAPKQIGERLVTVDGVTREVSPEQMQGLTPDEQAQIAAYNQAITYNPNYPSPVAEAPPSVATVPPGGLTRGIPPAGTAMTNPFYSSPAEQAADIRRAVALAQGPATQPTEINITGDNVPVGPATTAGVVPAGTTTGEVAPTTPGEYDYDPAQDPANYMRPIYPGDESQPGYLSPEQRVAYLQSLGDTRSSEFMTPVGREQDVAKVLKPDNTDTTDNEDKKDKPDKKRPRKKNIGRLKKDYMYTDYKEKFPRADSDILAFNRYNKRVFNKGGKVGDSVDAAVRIAKSKLL